MKIKALVTFDSHDRSFTIPCGSGDKTIKWLGIVASQRYSNAAPNGSLRRRDDYCGISERAQYQVENIYLPNGKIIHPGIFINESDLKDGDEVKIILSSRLAINSKSGSPHQSKWSTYAFTTNDLDSANIDSNHSDEEDFIEEDEEIDRTLLGANRETFAQKKAKADFMRIILQSQMVNKSKVLEKLDLIWPQVQASIPRMTNEEAIPIRQVLAANWDIMVELYEYYSTDGIMSKDNFLVLTEECDMFPAYVNATQSTKIYSRACKYANVASKAFTYSSLMTALLLCAQVKYNDTLDTTAGAKTSADAFYELFKVNFLPLAKRLQLQSLLKQKFCSNDCLSGIRNMYEGMQIVFNKYASKLQDIPSSLPMEDLTEILYLAGLVADINDHDKTRALVDDVRKGTIFGSGIDAWDAVDNASNKSNSGNINSSNNYNTSTSTYGHGGYSEPMAENDLAFPEFLECAARAGYYRYYDAAAVSDIDTILSDLEDNDGNYYGLQRYHNKNGNGGGGLSQQQLHQEGSAAAAASMSATSISGCLIMGVKVVADGSNNAVLMHNGKATPGNRGMSRNRKK